MITINFKVKNQILRNTSGRFRFDVSSDTLNQFRCVFELPESWQEYETVKAYFKNNSYNITKKHILDTENSCIIPWEVLAHTGSVVVHLVGLNTSEDEEGNEEVTAANTTNPVKLFFQNNEGYYDATIPPTPEEYGQYTELIEQYVNKITDMEIRCVPLPPGSEPTIDKEVGDVVTLTFGIPMSITDHNALNNRDQYWQHPISAITDLQMFLDRLQPMLIPGENITIEDNVISSTGGGGGASLPVFAEYVTSSDWDDDLTYEDFPYRASFYVEGMTEYHLPEVNFDADDSQAEYIAKACNSFTDGVYIYSSDGSIGPVTAMTIMGTEVVQV